MKKEVVVVKIGPWERVPVDFQEKWGGQWGCPCRDKKGKRIGYVAWFPCDESFQDTFSSFMPYMSY